jgi:hypothetical protein
MSSITWRKAAIGAQSFAHYDLCQLSWQANAKPLPLPEPGNSTLATLEKVASPFGPKVTLLPPEF